MSVIKDGQTDSYKRKKKNDTLPRERIGLSVSGREAFNLKEEKGA